MDALYLWDDLNNQLFNPPSNAIFVRSSLFAATDLTCTYNGGQQNFIAVGMQNHSFGLNTPQRYLRLTTTNVEEGLFFELLDHNLTPLVIPPNVSAVIVLTFFK
jgi:hypothetical protein